MSKKTIREARVKEVEKRRYPAKHYVFVIEVSWSEGTLTKVYRRYSDFFEFQCELLERFPEEGGAKDPAARMIPFLPGKRLLGRSHVRSVAEKRREKLDEYCRALIRLPPNISDDDFVINFFEVRPDDIEPKQDKPEKQQSASKLSEISDPVLLERFVAIADYQKQKKNECNLMCGQTVEVIDKNANGWWFVNLDDFSEGWVPATYLDPLYGQATEMVEVLDAGEEETFITMNEYTANNSDEISFMRGVLVEVFEKGLDGWWKIRYNDEEGMAPAAYLMKYQGTTAGAQAAAPAQVVASMKEAVHGSTAGSSSSIKPASAKPPAKQLSQPTFHSLAKPFIDKEPIYAPTPRRHSIKQKLKKRPLNRPGPPELDRPEPIYEVVTIKEEPVYMTIADFNAARVGDGLSFSSGMAVTVVTKNANGWWFVEMEDKEGWVPSSYLEKRQQPVSPEAKKPTSPTSPARPTPLTSKKPATTSAHLVPKPTSPTHLSPKATSPKPLLPTKLTPVSKASLSAKPSAPERLKLPTRPLVTSKSSDRLSDGRKNSLVRSTSSDSIYDKPNVKPSQAIRSRSPPPKPHGFSSKPVLPTRTLQPPARANKPTTSGVSSPHVDKHGRKKSAPTLSTNRSPPTIRTLRSGVSLDERDKAPSSSSPQIQPRKPSVSKTLSQGSVPQSSPRSKTLQLTSGTRSAHELQVPSSTSSRTRTNPRVASGSDSTDAPPHHKLDLERTLQKRSAPLHNDSPGNSRRVPPPPPSRSRQEVAVASPGKRAPPKRPTPPKAGAKKAAPPRPSKSPALKKKLSHVTTCSYDGSGDGCLSFAEGERVEVIERSSDGWWFVKIGGREGWAPSTFMEEIGDRPKPARPAQVPTPTAKPQQSSVDSPRPKPRPRARTTKIFRAIATYKVPAYEDSGVGLIEGRLYEVTVKSDDGWWLVKDGDREGWAPSSYLEAS